MNDVKLLSQKSVIVQTPTKSDSRAYFLPTFVNTGYNQIFPSLLIRKVKNDVGLFKLVFIYLGVRLKFFSCTYWSFLFLSLWTFIHVLCPFFLSVLRTSDLWS